MNLLTAVLSRLLLFTFLLSGMVLAQQQDDGIGMEGHIRNGSLIFETAVVAGPGTSDAVVTGQPYSATEVSEHTQQLANGTNIHQKWDEAMLYRDSQGRTRTERFTYAGALPVHTLEPGRSIVRISDPVAGYVYVLDTKRRIAHRLKVLTATETSRRVRSEGSVDTTRPAQKVAANPNLNESSPQPAIKQEALGKHMTDDGVEVAVRQVTMTTPEGLDGNDQPLVRVCENQYSEELKLTTLSKCSDPRAGNSATHLENLERTEPDPALFQVPADYTVVDEKDQFRIDLGTNDPPKEP
jgi:hypothetical protein